jgi:hypothetical protein
MTIALSVLVAELQALIPAQDGVPTAAQFERTVKQAVADFSRRTARTTETDIDIVSGTASYALPDDFLFAISLEREGGCQPWGDWRTAWNLGWPVSGGVYADNFQSPWCETCQEHYLYRGGTVTIQPTPDYSETKTLRYAWKHVLNASDEYEYLNSDGEAVRIVLLKAQAEALRILAVRESTGGSKVRAYSQGDVSVQLNAQGRAGDLRDAVKALQQEYDDAIAQFNELASGWCGWYQ